MLDAAALAGGDWRLVSDNPMTGIRTFRMDLGNGTSVERKEHYLTEALFDHNAAMRSELNGKKWGDTALVARIPLNLYFKALHEASVSGDDEYMNKWLNNSDNARFRTKEGRL